MPHRAARSARRDTGSLGVRSQRWNTKRSAQSRLTSFSDGFAATVALTVRSQSAAGYVVPMNVGNARIGSLSPDLEKAQMTIRAPTHVLRVKLQDEPSIVREIELPSDRKL